MLFMRGFGRGRFGAQTIPLPFFWVVGIVAAAGVGFAVWNLLSRGRETGSPRIGKGSIDQTLVQIARANSGRIRVGDLVERSNLSLEDARTTLDEYAKKGNLTIDYDDSGNVYYRLPGESPAD
jgi:hypothetical protein